MKTKFTPGLSKCFKADCKNRCASTLHYFRVKPRIAWVCMEHSEYAVNQLKSRGVDIEKSGPCCPFCNGTGFLPHLAHVSRGVCFRCNGDGIFGAAS